VTLLTDVTVVTLCWEVWEGGDATLAAGTGAKVIKRLMAGGKVIRRLPSTGAKVIKWYMPRWDTTGA
jgi:hypothetical protein